MATMSYYKIRRKSDPDKYVVGTPFYLSYDSRGRIFQSIGSLRTFITGVMNSDRRKSDISDWEIIELDMVVKEVKEVHEVITQKKFIELLTGEY